MLYLVLISSIPLPPGPQICLYLEFPCLLSGWCLQLSGRRVLSPNAAQRGAGAPFLVEQLEGPGSALPGAATGSGTGHQGRVKREGDRRSGVTVTCWSKRGADLRPLCLEMALGLLKEFCVFCFLFFVFFFF